MIKIFTLDNEKEWTAIVKSFDQYDVYYLPGYSKAFQINGDGTPILIYFERNGTRAINVVMKRDIADDKFFKDVVPTNTWYDFVTPYGYGGFLIEGSDYKDLSMEYIEFCKNENIICEFVRFHPLLKNWISAREIYEEIHLGDTVCIDTSSVSLIWRNIISKNRNMIRKAQKNGLNVYWGRDPEIIPQFIKIYNETMDKDHADKYYYFKEDFYYSILNDLKQNAMWFYAKKEGEIAAIAIFMFCNKSMHYHLSASRLEFQKMAPTNLLIYEAAVWAAAHGFQRLHLGGGVGSGHDSLYKFKKSFNREDDTNFYIGKCIFNREKYKELIELRKKYDKSYNENTNYFPKYRG